MKNSETRAAEKRYRRLIMSWYDLREAAESHARLMELNEFEKGSLDRSPDTGAHLTRMVVAYARPFGSNKEGRGGTKAHARLPESVLDHLGEAEAAMHERIRGLRDQEFAHSDADASGVTISIIEGGEPVVTAVSRRTRLLFTRAEMETIGECIATVLRATEDEKRKAKAELLSSR